MQSSYPDIRPTVFRLYRSDWAGNQIKVWEGRCCYLTDALEAYRALGGNLNAITQASFERLDTYMPRVYSERELKESVAWVQGGRT